jgi:streptogramin lyase
MGEAVDRSHRVQIMTASKQWARTGAALVAALWMGWGCAADAPGSTAVVACVDGAPAPTCVCGDGTLSALDCGPGGSATCVCPGAGADGDAGGIPDFDDLGRPDPRDPDAGDADAGETCQPVRIWPDRDGDGFGDTAGAARLGCLESGWSSVPGDCDDTDPMVYPGAAELCDGVDNNCNGQIDETEDIVPQWPDADGDGFGARGSSPRLSCERTPGWSTSDTDCDDTNPAIRPGVTDICDGIDNNCNGFIDEDARFTPWWPDADEDGFGDADAAATWACAPVDGMVDNRDDCDDSRSDVNPDAEEVCDLRDNNCDGRIDEGTGLLVLYPDADRDGFGDAFAPPRLACEPIPGMVASSSDCDDSRPDINPAATEVCDGLDNDCDGRVDVFAVDAGLFFPDRDGDGFGDSRSPERACEAPARTVSTGGDCDDLRPTVYPGAEEVCNGLDDNCNGAIDEGVRNACGGCGPVPDEICGNGLDDNCNGAIDEAAAGCFCDGRTRQPCYAGPPTTLGIGTCQGGFMDCLCPGGERICTNGTWGACEGQVLPTTEVCDGVDNNCDGRTDEGLRNACGTCGPAPVEVCDGVDNNCNGLIDEGVRLACGLCPGEVGGDEICANGLDDNCDGRVDEGCACEADAPCWPFAPALRGVGQCTDGVAGCYAPGVSDGTCLGAVGPSVEVCDGIDNNCDGRVDEDASGCSVCGITEEICDGVDNNCDGQVDEGLRNACGQCLADVVPERLGGPALCDGIDNDCNGLIDEGLLNACGSCGLSCYADLTAPSAAHDLDSGAQLIPPGDPANPTGRPGVTLSRRSFIPPYLWAANETNNTVSRFNTETLREEGRYWVGLNPSRTAVDLDGNMWVGGRDDGRLTKILWDTTTCPDRNGDGRVNTSVFGSLGPLNGPGNPLADECVVFSAVPQPTRPSIRGVAAAPDGRVWFGFTDGGVQSIDPFTFEYGPFIPSANSPRFAPDINGVQQRVAGQTMSPGGIYGMVVDRDGQLYISSFTRDTLSQLDTRTGQWVATYTSIGGAYGIAVDGRNRIWLGGWPTMSGVTMFDPATRRAHRFAVPANTPLTTDNDFPVDTVGATNCDTVQSRDHCVTGVAVEPATGDVWANFYRSGWTARLRVNEANLAASRWRLIPGIQNPATNLNLSGVSNDLRGVGFDGQGFAYILGLGSDRIWRIDPATNRRHTALPNGLSIGVGTHYTYSDFTGSTALSFTSPRGFWRYLFNTTVSTAQIDAVEWEAYAPAGTQVGLRLRPVDVGGNPTGPWVPEVDGGGQPQYRAYPTGAPSDTWTLGALAPSGGRFEIEVRMSTSNPDVRPIVHSVELRWQRP